MSNITKYVATEERPEPMQLKYAVNCERSRVLLSIALLLAFISELNESGKARLYYFTILITQS
jgi:hypothetical protein